ncbi:MAG: ImmA/IrrE family metallo-endopeptidase [Deltaproteobacteria bacterium]|nr:ImmA/IrrE family metallo-endopeptidase [Deltaproteobacteria bacterium]
MILDTVKVPWLPQTQIENAANDLLRHWANFSGREIIPPIPVEAIVEKYLGITLEYDKLENLLGIPDVLGATWVEEKRMVINSSLLDGRQGRFTFTCGHEVGHWVLHRKYLFKQTAHSPDAVTKKNPPVVCRVSAAKTRGEWQADYFSASLIMPGPTVREAFHKVFGGDPLVIFNRNSCFGRNNPLALDPSLDTAHQIAKNVIDAGQFQNVSKEAMAYRLEDLGLLVNETGLSLSSSFQAKKPFCKNSRERKPKSSNT